MPWLWGQSEVMSDATDIFVQLDWDCVRSKTTPRAAQLASSGVVSSVAS